MTPQMAAESVSERDLVMLMMYARRHMLPTRRLQLQIARLCQITAGDGKALGEYLFDPPAEGGRDAADGAAPADAEEAGEALGEMAGVGVRYLGAKRRAGALQEPR